MFATLAGSYPRPAALRPADALRAVLVAQAGAGLGLLSDGMVHDSDEASMLVDAWIAAREAASAEGIGQPVKLAVLGPWARVSWAAGAGRLTSAGLASLEPALARALIELLGEAARLLVGDPDLVLSRLDPRAVDLRSAALGEYRPRRRERRWPVNALTRPPAMESSARMKFHLARPCSATSRPRRRRRVSAAVGLG